MIFKKLINTQQRINRFRVIVLVFFLCLILPLTLVIYYGFQKFENETLFQYRWKSTSAVSQFNKTLAKRLLNEQVRSPLDYNYFKNTLDKQQLNSWQNRSPLSRMREPHYLTDLFGLVGYFNITDQKTLSSPLLPYKTKASNKAKSSPFSETETDKRLVIIAQLQDVLSNNGFLNNVGNSSALNTEKISLVGKKPTIQTSRFKMLETKYQQLIFYRDVSINQQSSVQGFVVNKKEFLFDLLNLYVRRAGYDNNVQLQLVDTNNAQFKYFSQYSIDNKGKAYVSVVNELNQALISKDIYKGELVSPFEHLTLHFTTGDLPLGPATHFVVLFILVMIFVIVAGCFGFYWLGLKQIALAEQRMNFVSSVSHELKTPLTSILMYSEMLKTGMVKDKNSQFDYYHFIYDESERLSRLINNVLQLSNLSQEQNNAKLEYVSVEVLQDIIRSKVSSLIDKNGFTLVFKLENAILPSYQALVDLDAFSQIVINLVDNAVKFYQAANISDEKRQRIEISFSQNKASSNKLIFSIRDFGPGISKSQHDKIFDLFYRCGNELTRTTSGTGIGLALVHQLVSAQQGQIQVHRHTEGVAFEITFTAKTA